MNKSTSLYLDFLRVIAAFGVVLFHANLPWFSNGLFFSDKYGHKFVMIFFVLSGYLIAFTVNKKNKGITEYIIDRLSRLYSVVWPALLLTFILDYIGSHINPTYYVGQITPSHQMFRYIINAAFLSQIWNLCTKPSSNGPFWSICYEFWYYMLFAAWVFLSGKKRYITIVLICLLIGYKILLLLPVWIFGVLAFRIGAGLHLKKMWANIVFITSLCAVIILTFFWDFSVFSDLFIEAAPPLYFSSHFVFDWVYGAVIAVNLFSIGFVLDVVKIPSFIERIIKYLSSITFSLYLFHLPMLVLVGALLRYNRSSYLQIVPILTGIIIVVALLSEITEKQRNFWRRILKNIFLIKNVCIFNKKQ